MRARLVFVCFVVCRRCCRCVLWWWWCRGVAGTAAAWSRDKTFSEWQQRPCLCLCLFVVALPTMSVVSRSGGWEWAGYQGKAACAKPMGGGGTIKPQT